MSSIYSRMGAVIVFLLSCLVTYPSFVSSSIQFTSGMNSRFIQSARRLEYFINRYEYVTNNPVSDDEKLEFASDVLDTGSDGLVYSLHNLHEGIVARGGTSSALEVYYNRRRVAGSADYMKETVRFADELLQLQTSGYTVGTWACNIKNNGSCFAHLSNELIHRLKAQELFFKSKRVYAFSSPNVQSFNWCSCGSCKPLLGDFDGNRRADMLCYKGDDGSSRLTTFDETSGNFFNRNTRWHRAGERCGPENVYVGRFNRDSRSDMLCLKPRDRQKMRMVYSTSSGYLASSTGWQGNHEVVTRCLSNSRSSAIYTGDFNGDGKTDVMCQNHVTGDMRITYKPTDPVLFTWRWVVPWCRTATTQLFIGDFDGDRRDDLLCQDWRTGGSSIKMASYRGSFIGDVRWEGLYNFCRRNSGGTLFVGDFNGDRRSDLLCYSHRSRSRDTLKIAYANRSGHFENSQMVVMNFDWCSSPGARLRNVSDVNGDGRADLVCYDHNRRLSVALNDEYLYFGQ